MIPKKTDVFMYGCEGNILQLLKLPDGTVKVLVEGSKRVKILDFKDNEKFIICEYAHHHDVVLKMKTYTTSNDCCKKIRKTNFN